MKRIGDVLNSMPTAVDAQIPRRSIKIRNRDTVQCPICQDAGYLRANVPVGHPSFGRLYPCECKEREINERRDEELRRLSNLDAFSDYTFESFDPELPGMDEAYDASLRFAQETGLSLIHISEPTRPY